MFCFMKGHVLHFMLLRLFNHVVLASRWGNALHVEQVTAMVVFSHANTNTNTNSNANDNTNTMGSRGWANWHLGRVEAGCTTVGSAFWGVTQDFDTLRVAQ